MQGIEANTLLRAVGVLEQNPVITSVITDSREAKKGSLFVCIAGERADGHDYAKQTVEQGAEGILAQRAVLGVAPQQTVLVDDPLDAMIAMGGNYRAQFSPILVGVTGSVGKTTTKEFCYSVFSAFGQTLKTEGNQNNEIGMPNTLFRLGSDTQYAVIEMGMQGLGEIAKLTRAAQPCGAIITGIGVSHLEQLGSRENICKAKLEICEGMAQGAPLVVNGDDDLLPVAPIRADLQKVLFAIENKNADVVAQEIKGGTMGTHFTIVDKRHGRFAAYIPAMGSHNVMDALSAYALATRLGLDPARAAAALENYKTTGHRQNLVRHGGVAVFEDCYNASPDSMRAALATLRDYPINGKRIALLGDMFELGTATQNAHVEIGDLCAACGVSLLITVGEAMQLTHTRAASLGVEAVHCGEKQQAAAVLRERAQAGDAVLVKASHGMEFEKILSAFYAEDVNEEKK